MIIETLAQKKLVVCPYCGGGSMKRRRFPL